MLDQAISDYYERGFSSPVSLGDDYLTPVICREIDHLVKSTSSTVYGFETPRDRHLDIPLLLAVVTHPLLKVLVKNILGSAVIWRSKLMVKEPGGESIPFHQDNNFPGYRNQPALASPNCLTVWIALDEVNLDNGCLQFLPGTYHELFDNKSQPWGKSLNVSERVMVDMPLNLGEFVFFNHYTVHGSRENKSNQRRLGLTVRFTQPNVRVFPDGEAIDGQGHPINRHRCVLIDDADLYCVNPAVSEQTLWKSLQAGN